MKNVWIVLLSLTCIGLKGQSKASLPTPEKRALRLNPMGLVDVTDGNLSAGVEQHLDTRWSITTDLSLVLYSAYIPENRRALGYIIKPAVRYYTSDERKLFLELSLFYKRVGYKLKDWLGKDYVNGIPAYEEFETFIFRKRVVGVNAQGGWQKNLTRNNLLRMEIYIGIGIRYKWQDIKNDPRAYYEVNPVLFNPEFEHTRFFAPSIPHGLRLVYIIQ